MNLPQVDGGDGTPVDVTAEAVASGKIGGDQFYKKNVWLNPQANPKNLCTYTNSQLFEGFFASRGSSGFLFHKAPSPPGPLLLFLLWTTESPKKPGPAQK
jgi:hypothetical protein